jgi:hypothetical protein
VTHGAGGNFAGPTREERHAQAAFGGAKFITTVQAVGKIRAFGTVGVELGGGAVVGHENDERVIGEMELVEGGKDAAKSGVEVFDHGRVDRKQAAVGEAFTVLGNEFKRRLERIMRGVEGEVMKKGFRLSGIAPEASDGAGGEFVRVITRDRDRDLVVVRFASVPKRGRADE